MIRARVCQLQEQNSDAKWLTFIRRTGFNCLSFVRKSAGVMELWSDGVMIVLVKILVLAFTNTPVLQNSSPSLSAKPTKSDVALSINFSIAR